MILQIIQFLMVITGTIVGVSLAYGITSQYENFLETDNPEIKLATLLGCIGYLFASMASRELQSWVKLRLEKSHSFDLFWGAVGLLLGLVTINLLLVPVYLFLPGGLGSISLTNKYFSSLVPLLNLVIPLLGNLFFAYLGMAIMFRFKSGKNLLGGSNMTIPAKVIDTSSIIDGRFCELFQLGFLEGNLIIPKYVLNELQLIADSSDSAKRQKGKFALDVLFQLRKEKPDQIIISEIDFPEIFEVDAKLVKHTQIENACLITLDYNLKRIAELNDVHVLNLNDLVNALKPIAMSGEEIEVQIIKVGKEPGQGVGYLTDGTMVVIENGGMKVGKKVQTVVTNILQTSAGRMIFSRIPDSQKKEK